MAELEQRDRTEYVVRGSHRNLVPSLPDVQGEQGMVVVPASRVEPTLDTAARLARDLRWQLLLLCSRGNQARWARHFVARSWPELPVSAADLLHRDLLRARRPWRTREHPAAREREAIDTHRKRNLGLAAARMTGQPWVLFVDDDVLRLSASHVVDALGHLLASSRRVASWPCDFFPDNSVVHHARRAFLGLHQDVFLTGGALLVRTDEWDPPR